MVVLVSLSQPLGDMNHFTAAVGAITKIVACCGVRRWLLHLIKIELITKAGMLAEQRTVELKQAFQDIRSKIQGEKTKSSSKKTLKTKEFVDQN